MKLAILIGLCSFIVHAVTAKHWSVLVAGSNTWDNYRHQADVCHAYQIIHSHGIPDEQIVVMMYDDIANNAANPTPGTIINHVNGKDVYAGVLKDYTGDLVTSTNFLNVLKGNKEAMNGKGSGKVIESGPDDYIFVNLVDHGATGLFAFPTNPDVLNAKDLIKTLLEMNEQKKFKQMVIYMESCESGSMFYNLLPKNVNIYATTAANRHESSYACYWSDKYENYLGDLYSVKWMEDSDAENLGIETLQKQFQIVRQLVNLSHVQEFGDVSLSDETVDIFEGNDTPQNLRFRPKPLPTVPLDAVASEDVTVETLKRTGQIERLRAVLKEHKTIKCQMKKIVHLSSRSNRDIETYLRKRSDLTAFNCYMPVSHKYLQSCRSDSEGHDGFHLRQMHVLVNLCQDNIAPDTIMAAIDRVCSPHGNEYCG